MTDTDGDLQFAQTVAAEEYLEETLDDLLEIDLPPKQADIFRKQRKEDRL